jgi:hypothetical protein
MSSPLPSPAKLVRQTAIDCQEMKSNYAMVETDEIFFLEMEIQPPDMILPTHTPTFEENKEEK